MVGLKCGDPFYLTTGGLAYLMSHKWCTLVIQWLSVGGHFGMMSECSSIYKIFNYRSQVHKAYLHFLL
jgi:hypothetical protein